MNKKDVFPGILNGIVISIIVGISTLFSSWIGLFLPFVIIAIELAYFKEKKSRQNRSFYILGILIPLIYILYLLAIPLS